MSRGGNGHRIGIVSDIHCNTAGLQTALDLMGPIDQLISLGDSIYEYRFSNDVVALLRKHNAVTLWGNHEEVFFSDAGRMARERPGIDMDLLAWLRERPRRVDITIAGKRICMVHAAPWAPSDGPYLYPGHEDLFRLGETEADIVLYGHTHIRLAQRIKSALVVNPGSAGEGRDPRNSHQLSCAVLEPDSELVEFFEFPDPGPGIRPLS